MHIPHPRSRFRGTARVGSRLQLDCHSANGEVLPKAREHGRVVFKPPVRVSVRHNNTHRQFVGGDIG